MAHDTLAYTQGLIWNDGVLYESTGQYGRSSVRRLDDQSGQVRALVRLPANRFGEGLAMTPSRHLVQLTWREEIAYVYSSEGMDLVDSLTYEGEGWGLASDGEHLVRSDGSSWLYFHDPDSFSLLRRVQVLDASTPMPALNELDYAKGWILANVYRSDWIVRIDPRTGLVHQWYDLQSLYPQRRRRPNDDVMNGIAFRPSTNTVFLTGKNWPYMWEVQLSIPPYTPVRDN